MAHEVQGVIARGVGAPVELATIIVPNPGPGEAVVRIQACGVCHTDLHYREGGISHDFPFLLGHEAAGIVEEVGAGVVDVQPGDYVVLNWRAVCGQCRSCLRGRPHLCFATHNAAQKMRLEDGTVLSPALGIGAFVEKHPSMKILALSFLLLIGTLLVAESLGQHISKGYIYFAMAFSVLVELLNLRFRSKVVKQVA